MSATLFQLDLLNLFGSFFIGFVFWAMLWGISCTQMYVSHVRDDQGL